MASRDRYRRVCPALLDRLARLFYLVGALPPVAACARVAPAPVL